MSSALLQPLAGRSFLVTRARPQAESFAQLLEAQGAEAICIPTIEIVAPQSWQALDLALRELEDFDLVVLTSVNGVRAFLERLQVAHQNDGLPTRLQVVAVGPKTAAALEQNHVRPDLVPSDYRAEGVVDALQRLGVKNKRVLYPRAELARTMIIDGLTEAGAEVVAPVAYRTLVPEGSSAKIRSLLEQDRLDGICFSSPSTFNNLLRMLDGDLPQRAGVPRLFSIGPQTSKAIRAHGYQVDLEPEQSTLDALVRALVAYYS
jgi:uroporphyrinogen III methyltransferase/synthase